MPINYGIRYETECFAWRCGCISHIAGGLSLIIVGNCNGYAIFTAKVFA